MRVALVYDRVNKFGGAEQVLLALHTIWPDAPLFTAVYDSQQAKWARVFRVKPSILMKLPFAKNHHEFYPWITPFAFEQFTFDEFDVVITVTSAEAKNIITKPETLHVCYCLTPTRYLWSGFKEYQRYPGLGLFDLPAASALKWMAPYLRQWDVIASKRPDRYIPISHHVASRIKTHYDREVSSVIYPPVNTKTFVPSQKKSGGDYYLTVSRLVGYKRVDLLIDACTHLGLPLVVVGDGRDSEKLKKRAGRTIRFVSGHLTETELVGYYQSCRAFLFAAEEDFGIAVAEAQACGKPVIAFAKGGVSEIVRHEKTGLLFDSQDRLSVEEALKRFEKREWDSAFCRKNAMRFDKKIFQAHFKREIDTLWLEYKHTI